MQDFQAQRKTHNHESTSLSQKHEIAHFIYFGFLDPDPQNWFLHNILPIINYHVELRFFVCSGQHPSSEGKRRRNRSNVEAMAAKHMEQEQEHGEYQIFNELKMFRIPAVFCIQIRIDFPLLEPGPDPVVWYVETVLN
jgi:hypothetical protein